jgi:hypothetical protein
MYDVSIEHLPSENVRHVDVAILYGLGQKDRAHEIALALKPKEIKWSEEEVKEFIEDSSNYGGDRETGIDSGKGGGWFSRWFLS